MRSLLFLFSLFSTFFPFCQLASAAPEASKTTSVVPLVIDFPDKYSLGELYLLKVSAGSGESQPGASTHFPARGRMKFPPGTRALLKVGYDGSQHMADLEKLPPSALFGISVKLLEVTDDDLKHVARLTGLEHVELEGTDISTKGVNNLEPLKKLRFLGIDKTMIKGDAMKSIGTHTALENLVIGHNDLDDGCYKNLVGLKNVTNLQVDCVHMSDKAIDDIVKLPNLAVIKLAGNNRISDKAMAKFQNSKMEAFNVQRTGVGPASVPFFMKMPRLTHLKLESKNFTPEQQKIAKKKLPKVIIQFQGLEKDYPQGMFDPLH